METVSESLDQGDRVPDLQEPHADHQREDGGRGQLCGERGYGVLPERLKQGRHRVGVSLDLGFGEGRARIGTLEHFDLGPDNMLNTFLLFSVALDLVPGETSSE